jgi:hypothetical protein
MILSLPLFAQGTWDPDVRLTTHSAAQRTRIWDNGRNIVVDSQDRIYITWMDEREGDSDIYLRKFENGAWQTEIPVTQEQSYQSDSRNPSMVVVPGDPGIPRDELVWIAWVDNPGSEVPAPPYEAYYKTYNTVSGQLSALSNLSTFGGDPVVFWTGASGTTFSKNGISMTQVNNGSKVYIFYTNQVGIDPNLYPIGRIMTKTFENGSLSPETAVSNLDGNSRLFPFALADNAGNTFLVHNRVLHSDESFRKRDPLGAWGPETSLGSIDPQFEWEEGVPWIARDDLGDIHITWLCGPGDGDRWIVYRKYSPSTNTWVPPLTADPTILTEGESLNQAETFSSLVADHTGDVWCFWHREFNGFEIRYRRKTSAGWQSTTVLSTASGDAESPVCAVDSDNNIHVIWSDNRSNGNWDVYYKKMDAIPYPPATLTYENFNGNPKLIWNKSKSKDTAGYKVYRGGGVIATKNSATDTTHVDPDVYLSQAGLNITYTVRAFDSHVPSQLSNPSPTLTVTGNYGKTIAGGLEGGAPRLAIRNFPNPFNPATGIIYEIPTDGQVSLVVLDALGRNVASLVDEFKKAGTYSIEFEGADLSSGIYFYRLHHNGTAVTGKMMLMR